jgi:hypothetical protein
MYAKAGKNINHKSMMTAETSLNNLNLKNESEDTCGDEFFATHLQKSNEVSSSASK